MTVKEYHAYQERKRKMEKEGREAVRARRQKKMEDLFSNTIVKK